MQSIPIMNPFQQVGQMKLTVSRCYCSNPILNKRDLYFLSVITICLSVLLSVPFWAVAAPPGFGKGPPPLVAVDPVVVRDINPPNDYVGHVEAIQVVDIRARVEGFLEKVNFREGNYVHSGDLLYVIEQAPYKAKVDSDKALVAQAEAEFTRSKQRLDRLRSALPESVPALDLDEALADELRAKAQVAGAKAALTRSMLDMTYTMIHAPISGRIGRTAYTQGNLVGPTSVPLARIVRMDPIRVLFSISENDLGAVQTALKDAGVEMEPGQNQVLVTRLRLPDGTIFKGQGRIDFVDNQVDSATGTIAVRAEFDNPEGKLIPGQYVNVLLTMVEPELLPVVPQAAVQKDHEGAYVLTVDKDNHVVVRRIKTGPIIEEFWAVESGLSEGEMVIVEGIQKVQPGMTVKTTTNDKGQGR